MSLWNSPAHPKQITDFPPRDKQYRMSNLCVVTLNNSTSQYRVARASKRLLASLNVEIDLMRGVWTVNFQPGRVFKIGDARTYFKEHLFAGSIVRIFDRTNTKHLEAVQNNADWPCTPTTESNDADYP